MTPIALVISTRRIKYINGIRPIADVRERRLCGNERVPQTYRGGHVDSHNACFLSRDRSVGDMRLFTGLSAESKKSVDSRTAYLRRRERGIYNVGR
jgi:hypothetical protein